MKDLNIYKNFRKTKIIATLGPACHSVEKISEMIEQGMNCARFNFSHGDHAEHKERYDLLHEAMKITGKKVALLLDTKGPEIRTGIVEGDPIELEDGGTIIVSGKTPFTTSNCISLSYENIHNEINLDNRIKIADGSIILQVDSISGENINCTIIKGGRLSSKKNVNIPGAIINLPSISVKDIDDIKFAIQHKYDFIAASFIRNSEAVLAIREILTENNSPINIISKIENQEGLDNLESIVQMSDGIMVARGDLAEQIPAEQVPLVQKKIIKYCVQHHKIAITATQMLQSMETSLTPTRAELTDVANAIFDGTDAIMLSGETAQGKYPAEAIATMNRVSLAVESSEQFIEHASKTFFAQERTALLEKEASVDSMIVAAQIIANKINASALVCPSLTGNTPKLVSVLRPPQPIIATTHLDQIFTQLLLLWGTYPIMTVPCTTDKELIDTAINKTREAGFLQKNGKVVIVAGLPINKPLLLNTVQVHFDGSIIARGRQGCGPSIQGRFFKANSIDEIEQHRAENNTQKYAYCLKKFSFSDLPILHDIEILLVEQPSEVPIEIISKKFPNVAFISHVNELMFQHIVTDREIVVAGTEKYIYEP